jgi:hypothetical protein
MKCYVVTVGPNNATLLQALLEKEFAATEFEIRFADQRSEAISRARTLLVTRRWPLAFVEDAETTSELRLAEQRVNLEEVLGLVGGRDQFTVILAKPALTGCLFLDEEGLRTYFEGRITLEQWIRARFEPTKVLQELLPDRNPPGFAEDLRLLAKMLDRDKLLAFPALQSLLQFIERARELTPA